MLNDLPAPLLSDDEKPVASVYRPQGGASVLLICEHGCAAIPRALGDMGLTDTDRLSHAVWDIGAEALARRLADGLDAPLVQVHVSRVVYDCNRPPESASAIPVRSEVIDIPGNSDLSAAERGRRVTDVYQPFRDLVSRTLDGFEAPPAIITVHTFTPVFFGARRTVELGVLHDADDRLAQAVLRAARDVPGLDARMNEPYGADDGVTHSLQVHAVSRSLPNVMLEIRNDLVADETGVAATSDWLLPVLKRALAEIGQGAAS